MASKNTELAQKIVDQYAEASKTDDGTYVVNVPLIGHKGHYFKTKDVEVEINSDGDTEVQAQAVNTKKAEALKLAVADIAKQLDDGVIVLSDTWAEDNLQ